MLYPERFIDFEIPWKINLTHVFSMQANTNKLPANTKDFTTIQTLSVNADASFTKRWKISGTSYYDVKTNKITNCNFTLTRNLHCWNLSFWVTPIGTNKSFLLRLISNATLLQDAKLELRKPPSIF
jgi:lipopolysaccharide assembly outer membrane protein LptD (OstA)